PSHVRLLYFLLAVLAYVFLFFTDTSTPQIYTLSLHDALPIYAEYLHPYDAARLNGGCSSSGSGRKHRRGSHPGPGRTVSGGPSPDRKSTRLNSSHVKNSYAVFCLKKKNRKKITSSNRC